MSQKHLISECLFQLLTAVNTEQWTLPADNGPLSKGTGTFQMRISPAAVTETDFQFTTLFYNNHSCYSVGCACCTILLFDCVQGR